MKGVFIQPRILITEGLRCIDHAKGKIDQAVLLKEPIALFPQIKEGIATGIFIMMMSAGKSSNIIRHLHWLQKDSVLLLNLIWQHGQKERTGAFYTAASNCLIGILELLEQNDCKYFNPDQAVPFSVFEDAVATLDEKMNLLKAGLKGKKVDQELQDILLGVFKKFQKKSTASYRHTAYMLKLQDILIETLQGSGKINYNDALTSRLLRHGFNAHAFIQYFKIKITTEMMEDYQIENQLETLYYYEKELRPRSEKVRFCYDSKIPACRSVLLSFVRAELDYLDKKHQYSSPKPNNKVTNNTPSVYRIKTTLSVDGLAYLLRLLIEAEVIDATPKTDLMAFVGQHFQTRGIIGNGIISANSLTTKYNQITQSTAVGMRSLLVKMTKNIDDNFGR